MPQRNYTLEIISEVGAAKPATTPLDPQVQLKTKEFDEVSEKGNTDSLPKDPSVYKRLIEKLLYLIVTRQDISCAIQTLSLFLIKPKKSHLDVALRVVTYMKGQAWVGILLSSTNYKLLQVYCDSDSATCPHSRRSITGFLFKLGDSSSHGIPRSMELYQEALLKLSIGAWQIQQLRQFGQLDCSKNWEQKLKHM